MTKSAKILVRAGHVQPIWAGHPWLYAQAVGRVEGEPRAGDVIDVVDPKGNLVGRGLYSPESAIPVRLLTREAGENIDRQLFRSRISAAIERRQALGLPDRDTDVYRVVHGEGDLLPGLIVDRLGDCLAVQFATVGMARFETEILDCLEELLRPRAIVDRSSARSALREGLNRQAGQVLRGELGEGVASPLRFRELGVEYELPRELGQKTGFYADQRELRVRLQELCKGKELLDAFCYVGACGLAAARAGAKRVVGIDSSEAAVRAGRQLVELNGFAGLIELEQGKALRFMHAHPNAFDVVLADPPKLAGHRRLRGGALVELRKIAAGASLAVRSGGLVILSSCSASVDMLGLTQALALGARDANRLAWVRSRLYQAADHPTLAAFPEGLYLNTIVAEIR